MTKARSIPSRFWEKVNKSNLSGCWIWTKSLNEHGYGQFYIGGKRVVALAHRVSYELAYGKISNGMFVCHKCDNPPCVNPEHLFLGTRKDNMDDMFAKGRYKSNAAKISGELNWNAKLDTKKVLKIRNLHQTKNLTIEKLAKMFDVCNLTIKQIITRKTWKHI